MQPRVNRDLLSGLILLAIGGAFAWNATSYGLGTPAHMGPGYFPLMLGVALGAVGLVISIGGLFHQVESLSIPWRELLLIALSLVAFALLIEPFGLFPALAAALTLACLADTENRWRQTVAVVLFSCALIWLIFVVGLGSPVPLVKV